MSTSSSCACNKICVGSIKTGHYKLVKLSKTCKYGGSVNTVLIFFWNSIAKKCASELLKRYCVMLSSLVFYMLVFDQESFSQSE